MPLKTPEEKREWARQNYQKNKEKLLKKSSEWAKANKEKRREICKRWRDNNPEKYKTNKLKQNHTFVTKRREWYAEIKEQLTCIKCGENRWWVLEFHHRDPNEKEANIAAIITCWSKKRIIAEIAKCDILCANCHKDEHYQLKLQEE